MATDRATTASATLAGKRPLAQLRGSDIVMLVAIYATGAALWILFSDSLLLMTDDSRVAAMISVSKGLLFVVVTSLLLYQVLRRLRSNQPGTSMPFNGTAFERSLRWMIALAVVTILVVGALHVRTMLSVHHAESMDQLEMVAEREATAFNQWLGERRREAASLAHIVEALIETTPEAQQAPLDQIVQAASRLAPYRQVQGVKALMIVDGQGEILYSSADTTVDAEPGVDSAAARDAWSGNRIRVTAHYGIDSSLRALDLIAPLEGAPRLAALVLRVDGAMVRRQLRHAVAVGRFAGDPRLFRSDGEEIVYPDGYDEEHKPGQESHTRSGGFVARILSGETPTARAFEIRTSDGDDLVVVAHLIDELDWLLTMSINRSALSSVLEDDLSFVVGGIAMALVLPVLLGLVLTQRNRLRLMEVIDRQREERLALARHYDTLMQKARDMILLVDESDHIVDANESARERYGWSIEELRGKTVSELAAPGHPSPAQSEGIEHNAAAGLLFETWHQSRDGKHFPVEISSRTVHIDGRRFRQEVLRDITERRRNESRTARLTGLYRALGACNRAIIRSRNRDTLFAEVCQSLVESGGMDIAWIGVPDRSGQRVMPAAVFGKGGEDFVSEQRILMDPDRPRSRGPTAVCLREGRAIWSGAGLRESATASGHEPPPDMQWPAFASLPIHTSGDVAACLNLYSKDADFFDEEERHLLIEMVQDLSHALDHLTTIRSLRERESRWNFALDGSAQGVWDRDIETDTVFYSSQWKQMLGYRDTDVARTRAEWRDRVHPNDIDAVESAIDAHLRGETDYYTSEYRMHTRDGRYMWVLDRGKVVARDDDGRALRIIGTHSDITPRKQIEQALIDQTRILEDSQSIAHIGSWELDIESDTVNWSTEMYRIFNLPRDGFNPSVESCLSLVHEEDKANVRRWFDSLGKGESRDEIEYRIIQGDATVRWVSMRGVPVLEHDRPSRIIGTLQDITESRDTQLCMRAQLDELQRWYDITVDREERVINLKGEVNSLLERLGESPRYRSPTPHEA